MPLDPRTATGHQIIEAALIDALLLDPNRSPAQLSPEAAAGYQQGLAAAYQHALEMIPAPSVAKLTSHAFNDWWLSLPNGRRAVLVDDKWALAAASYAAGSQRQDAAP